MNVLPEGNNSLDGQQVGALRSVLDIRKCGIVYDQELPTFENNKVASYKSVSISPTGFLFMVSYSYPKTTVQKFDNNYNALSEIQIGNCSEHVDSCNNSHNDFLVVCGKDINEYKLFFVDVKDKMSLNKSVSIRQECRSLTCHSDKLYLIDEDSVYVYSSDGEFIEKLYNKDDFVFRVIAVSNDSSLIYILNSMHELITINSSGNYLFKLNIPKMNQLSYWSTKRRMCVDDQGNVFILADKSSRRLTQIIQISPNGQKCYGALFTFDRNINYESIVFDSNRCALVLVGSRNMITVLTLR
jgi:hypothetical protein